MAIERRRFARVAYPIEGTWQTASGGSVCRIDDFGLGGCFIYTRPMPATGEKAEIAMAIGDDLLRFTGVVVYLQPSLGFAVEFRNLTGEQRTQIAQILDALSDQKV